MTNEKSGLEAIFAGCWTDDSLKAAFMSDPKSVLANHGIDVPESMNIKVVENTDDTTYIVLPSAPSDPSNLDDAELASAAGGWNDSRINCPPKGSVCALCKENPNRDPNSI